MNNPVLSRVPFLGSFLASGPHRLRLDRVPHVGRVPEAVANLSMRVHADGEDHVSTAIRKYGYWEPHETRLLFDLVKPGQVAVDVGANIGYHSMLLGALVGPGGRVYSFEPAHDNLGLIDANVALNGLSNITTIPAAVSDRAGYVGLNHYPLSRSCDSIVDIEGAGFAAKSIVPSATLDGLESVGVDRVDFLKIDIQGAELKALQGARDMLERNRGRLTMLLEYNVKVYVDQGDEALATRTLDDLRAMFDIRFCDPSVGEFFPLDMPSPDFIRMVAGAGGALPNGAKWTETVGYTDFWARPRG